MIMEEEAEAVSNHNLNQNLNQEQVYRKSPSVRMVGEIK
jgi:hypothetical protein